MMHRTVGLMGGLLLACLVVLADEDAPRKVEAGAKKANRKSPQGYEEAPQAGDLPAAREAADEIFMIGALELADAEAVDAQLEQLLAIDVEANVAALEKQFLPQFQPLLTAELSFINRACNLDLQQRKEIKAASDKCLKGAVRKYAMTQRGMMQVGFVRGQPTIPDPTELLHQALARVLEQTLRPEQQGVYDGEMEKRRVHRRRVALENVVASIDERLVLSNQQRRELVELLDKQWQPDWVQSLEMMLNNNQYLPSIPDQFVVPVLNDTQSQVWRASQKQHYGAWGGFAWGQVGAVEDFRLDEVEEGR